MQVVGLRWIVPLDFIVAYGFQSSSGLQAMSLLGASILYFGTGRGGGREPGFTSTPGMI